MQMLMRSQQVALQHDLPILVRHKVHEHGRRFGQEIEIREVATARDPTRLSLTARHRAGRRRTFGREFVANRCDLLAGLGRSQHPRIQQQRRTFERVPRKLPRVLPVDDVPVLVPDVPPRQINRLGRRCPNRIRLGLRDPSKMIPRRKRRSKPRRKQMHAGKLVGVAKLNNQLFVVRRNARNLQRRQRPRFKLPHIAEHIPMLRLTWSDANADVPIQRLQPQVVIPFFEIADRDQPILDRQILKPIVQERIASQFEERQRVP